jgi:prepilin-type N-terminal cleavage/methylation domain-containing protein
MLFPPRTSVAKASRDPRRENAFTLVEVLTATALFAIIASTVIWGLNMLQHRATVNRLYTQAQMLCQNQIDRVLTAGPYNPSAVPAQTPAELMPNQAAVPVDVGAGPGNTVSGTVTTTVTDTGHEYGGSDLKVKQAQVVVAYDFRGKTFSVEMNTLRAPDL